MGLLKAPLLLPPISRSNGLTRDFIGPEVGFAEIAIDFPQARFWTTSGLLTTRPNGTHLTQAAPARRTKNFTCEIVLSSEFRKR